MKVAVKDANILIDLVNGELLELCLRLPYEFVTTDLVLLQLEVEQQQWFVVQPFVDSGALRTVSLTGSEMEEVVADPIHSSLGLVDAQVLWLAAKEKGILLTGDLSLRQEAERRKVSVHGLLWVLTQIVGAGKLGPPAAPVQAEALLQTARECLPEMVAPIAIGLFAGLRRSELCALDWSEIDLAAGHIEVKGIKAKTRQRRLVSISDNLAEWLRPYSQGSGPVAFNVDLFGEKLRHLVQGRPKTDDDPGRPAIVAEWPHNALRHSFGSYFFGKSKNENLTAAEMGRRTMGSVYCP